jgi:hypothetical protein
VSTPHTEDIFDQRLTEATGLLQECQRGKYLESCYDCEQCIGCETRARYVRAVYESMSKGETGGFDF